MGDHHPGTGDSGSDAGRTATEEPRAAGRASRDEPPEAEAQSMHARSAAVGVSEDVAYVRVGDGEARAVKLEESEVRLVGPDE